MERIALITGGSKGIGLSLSQLLIRHEFKVFSLSRSSSKYTHPNFIQVKFDLSNIEKLPQLMDQFVIDNGVPDLLINNAGYGSFFEWDQFPRCEIHQQVDVLFKAPVMLCRKLVPLMADKNSGMVVNLSSLATLYPLPFMPLYNAGKSGLSSFTQSMMLEYYTHPVFIDFRMGDVQTGFNNSAVKYLSTRPNTKNAWNKIEKQLKHSISPDQASQLIWKRILNARSGTFYGGTIFHGLFLPFIDAVLPFFIKRKLLRYWYLLNADNA